MHIEQCILNKMNDGDPIVGTAHERNFPLCMHVHPVICVLCGTPIEDIGEGVPKLL